MIRQNMQNTEHYLKGIGDNHQKSIDQVLLRNASQNNGTNVPSQRSKISTAHDWKTEVNTIKEYKDWDPKNIS